MVLVLVFKYGLIMLLYLMMNVNVWHVLHVISLLNKYKLLLLLVTMYLKFVLKIFVSPMLLKYYSLQLVTRVTVVYILITVLLVTLYRLVLFHANLTEDEHPNDHSCGYTHMLIPPTKLRTGVDAVDPIDVTSLTYENTMRLGNMGSDYFMFVQPWYHAPRIPVVTGYHMYSYSLDFICLDPLGSTNYGKLTNVSITPEATQAAVDAAAATPGTWCRCSSSLCIMYSSIHWILHNGTNLRFYCYCCKQQHHPYFWWCSWFPSIVNFRIIFKILKKY